MALRSPALYMGNPAVNHTAQNDRLLLAGLLRPETGQAAATRPLTAVSGVLAGPDGTMGEVTLLSNTQFTVNPARWFIQSGDTPLGGAYEVTNDAVETLAVTAQDATQSRRSYFGVWVIDSFVAGSGDDQPHWGLVNGALAPASPTLPAAGALPENFLALGEFLIPATGGAVTYTPYNLRTGLRGSIVPVPTTDTRNGPYIGAYRDHPTFGLQRWNGTGWSGGPLTAWTTFQHASFTAGNPLPGYRKMADALVSLEGAILANNTSFGLGQAMVILPAGSRPVTGVSSFVQAGWGAGAWRCDIDGASGEVRYGAGVAGTTTAPAFLHLAGISFYAAN